MIYLFYSFYKVAVFIRKKGDPDIRAWFFFSSTQAINLYSLKQFNYALKPINKNIIPDFIGILIVLAIRILNYFLFLYKDRFKKIVKKYDNESETARIIGVIVGYLYLLLTVVFVFYAKHLQFG